MHCVLLSRMTYTLSLSRYSTKVETSKAIGNHVIFSPAIYMYVCNTEEDVKNRVIRTQNVQRYLDRLLQNKHYLSCEMELMYASNIIITVDTLNG